MGDNIFGCEAASQAYYKKSCFRLSLSEASRLAATLAMPSRLSRSTARVFFIQKRVEVIANNLYKRHMLDDSGYTPSRDRPAQGFVRRLHGRAAPAPVQKRPLPANPAPAGKPKRKHWF